MRRQEMLEALRTRPFRPFRMHLSDGTSHEVRYPGMVLVTPTSAVVGRSEPDEAPPAAQRYSVVDLLHITRLEPIEPTASR